MTLDLLSVELFARVAALGAIARAGAEFNLSPTTSTQRLQALEAELGVKLLHRTTRAVSLTGDGEIFLLHATRILSDVEDARLELSGGHSRIRGTLRVTASATFGRQHIAPHIPAFLAEHPGATVYLDLSDSVVDIVAHGYDLAIRVGTLDPSTLLARKLADSPRALVASPAYIKRFGTPKSPGDLSEHRCITRGNLRTWRLRGPASSIETIRVQGPFSTNLGEAVTEAALGGVGIALKSMWDVNEYVQDGRLVWILPKYRADPEWSIWSVRPPGSIAPARVGVFTRFLERRLADASDAFPRA